MGSSSGLIGAIASVVAPVTLLANSGIVNAAYSAYSGKKQNKAQKSAINEQNKIIAQEKAEELEKRKRLIDQQRMQLAGTGQGTRGTSTAGVRAILGDTLG